MGLYPFCAPVMQHILASFGYLRIRYHEWDSWQRGIFGLPGKNRAGSFQTAGAGVKWKKNAHCSSAEIKKGRETESMHQELLKHLSKITQEEQAILEGRTTIDRELYMADCGNTINSRKLLAEGKLITLRPHTRFIHFPEHRHDYVEVVYMCQGQTTHVVNEKTIPLQPGDLLFMHQSATHEVYRAEEQDIAVNFIVFPDFFAAPLSELGEEETPLRRFLVDCLCGQNASAGYLHFRASSLPMVQNLVENLLWTLLSEMSNKRKILQMTMALLFLQLCGHTEVLETKDRDDAIVIKVLHYIETNYAQGSLQDLSLRIHHDMAWLSREIKQKTGKTYTELVQEKRLKQAAFLLRSTNRTIAEISEAVGYENVSYFHRIFTAAYRATPGQYRLSC